MIDERIRNLAIRFLPAFLISRLDPIDAVISREVQEAADRLGDDQVVLDAGAGESRHQRFFSHGRYIAFDLAVGDAFWNYSKLDVVGNLEHLPFRSSALDCVLCMVVLEHTESPESVLRELFRILKPGGSLYLVVPFLWEEHQIPHDFHRFTRYELRRLLDRTSFQIELLQPMGGFFSLCARRSINFLGFFQSGWRCVLFLLLLPLCGFLLPLLLGSLDFLDPHRNFTLGFAVRARRVEASTAP